MAAYVYHFNVRSDYFECHECGESLWFDRGRPYVLKGFVQAAVCLYHLRRGNRRGATKMWARSRGYLTRYMLEQRKTYEGIDIARLVAQLEKIFARCGDTPSSDGDGQERTPRYTVRVRLARVRRGRRG